MNAVTQESAARVQPVSQNAVFNQGDDKPPEKELSAADKTLMRLNSTIENLRRERFVRELKRIGYT